MQGVVDAQPVDREVAVFAEVPVGKERVGEVTEFDEEALAESRLRQCVKQEAEDAFEERKSMARKLGEEAGTKLLLPMVVLLGVVMVIVMLPAIINF